MAVQWHLLTVRQATSQLTSDPPDSLGQRCNCVHLCVCVCVCCSLFIHPLSSANLADHGVAVVKVDTELEQSVAVLLHSKLSTTWPPELQRRIALCDVNRLIGADGRPLLLPKYATALLSSKKWRHRWGPNGSSKSNCSVSWWTHTLDGSLNMQIVVVVVVLPSSVYQSDRLTSATASPVTILSGVISTSAKTIAKAVVLFHSL